MGNEEIFHAISEARRMVRQCCGKAYGRRGTEKHEWTISLLNVEKEDNVLEIGFGPGIAIQRLTQIVQDGKIIGVDYFKRC